MSQNSAVSLDLSVRFSIKKNGLHRTHQIKQTSIQAMQATNNRTPCTVITWHPSWSFPADKFQCSHCQTSQSKCSSVRMSLLKQNGLKWPSVSAGLQFALGNRFWKRLKENFTKRQNESFVYESHMLSKQRWPHQTVTSWLVSFQMINLGN